MPLLIAGLALWFATHLFGPWMPERRKALIARIGEGGVKIAIALLTLAAIALIVQGYQRADYVWIWFPPAWTVHVTNLAMVIAFVVYTAGAFPGHVRAWIRHPQLTGVKLWSVSHLLVNGHLAAILLFGGMLAWAVLALIGTNRRDGKPPKPAAGALKWDAAHVGVSLGVFGAVAWVHNYLGVWPFPG